MLARVVRSRAQHVHAHRRRHWRRISLQSRRYPRARALPACDARPSRGTVDVYFEAAAVITTLVLLGQVLELRAPDDRLTCDRCASPTATYERAKYPSDPARRYRHGVRSASMMRSLRGRVVALASVMVAAACGFSGVGSRFSGSRALRSCCSGRWRSARETPFPRGSLRTLPGSRSALPEVVRRGE